MTRNEILENLCAYDKRNPIGVDLHRISRASGEYEVIYSESKDKNCTCRNCTSGKTKMAVAMLEMICCGNCKNDPNAYNYCCDEYRQCELDCNNYSSWELKK